jgi:hypothetical protein
MWRHLLNYIYNEISVIIIIIIIIINFVCSHMGFSTLMQLQIIRNMYI